MSKKRVSSSLFFASSFRSRLWFVHELNGSLPHLVRDLLKQTSWRLEDVEEAIAVLKSKFFLLGFKKNRKYYNSVRIPCPLPLCICSNLCFPKL